MPVRGADRAPFYVLLLQSIKVLPEGPHVSKAKFREAQARIGLGELTKGKTMLQELQKVGTLNLISSDLSPREED